MKPYFWDKLRYYIVNGELVKIMEKEKEEG